MTQRPEWRRRAAESGVLEPLVQLVEPGVRDIGQTLNVTPHGRAVAADNMLLQILLAINWCAPARVDERSSSCRVTTPPSAVRHVLLPGTAAQALLCNRQQQRPFPRPAAHAQPALAVSAVRNARTAAARAQDHVR